MSTNSLTVGSYDAVPTFLLQRDLRAMYEDLQIINYPDPRLRKVSLPVETFDDALKALVARMFQLMREHRGVGLAAPQVGQNIRLFVMNHSGDPQDDRVYINPELTDAEGAEEGEEGCLSLPGINAKIVRDKKLRIRAKGLDGHEIDQVETGYLARVWQHETDHLNGTLITDRMGAVAKMVARKKLIELEEAFASAQGRTKPDKKRM
ncbi:MAG TPA: peptide deformylase [Tepidisphaeraceae bacterium]|nr:peptide deformylase [Tepidisphaeraceae bacterium]